MKLSFFILDGVFDTGLSAMLDVLAVANQIEITKGKGNREVPFNIQLIGTHRQIRTAQGFLVTVMPIKEVSQPDWIIVPAITTMYPEELEKILERRDVCQAKEKISAWHTEGVKVAAACTGTFIVADTGILNGKEATTSWPLAPFFRQRYPQIKLDDSRMIKVSDTIVTAAAMMSHLDLALWFVRLQSPELATLVARLMLVDSRYSQVEYIIPDYLAHTDSLIEKYEHWCRENLSNGFDLQIAANALYVHPRTLQRKTEAVLGKSPLAFFQDLRIERAKQLAIKGYNIEAIATEVGYADSSTLRNLLRRKLGKGLREISRG